MHVADKTGRSIRLKRWFAAVFLVVLVGPVGESLAAQQSLWVGENTQERVNPIRDAGDPGWTADTDTYVKERPRHGRVIPLEVDGEYVYVPDDRFEGFDRFSVAALVGDEETEVVYHVTVGAPAIPDETIRLDRVAELLFLLLVIAIVLEIALSAIFQNRHFKRLDRRIEGLKTGLTVAAALVVVWSFGLDTFEAIVMAVEPTIHVNQMTGITSFVVTTLVLAGGSGGIFKLYERLGLRRPIPAGPSRLAGTGTLLATVRRGSADPGAPIMVMNGDDLVARIPGGQDSLGDGDGVILNAGLYELRAVSNKQPGNTKVETPVTAVGITPDEQTTVTFTFD